MKKLYIFSLFFFAYAYITCVQDAIIITQDDALLKSVDIAEARLKKAKINNSTLLNNHGFSLNDVQETIDFVKTTLQEDKKKHTLKSRLQDDFFLKNNFEWIPIKPSIEQAQQARSCFPPGVADALDNKMLLTKYASFKILGSPIKTPIHTCALYALSYKKRDIQKTKKEIVEGALDAFPTTCKPLVWVTRKGLEKALMQGTVVVVMPDHTERIFHIHTHNGHAYDPKKTAQEQNRYWFFKEVKSIEQLPAYHIAHILKTQHASFAGDLNYFGMGSLLTVLTENPLNKKKQRILGFLVDTGGAFKNNQYQLDLFVGVCDNDFIFQEKIRSLSENGIVHMLIKKRSRTS